MRGSERHHNIVYCLDKLIFLWRLCLSDLYSGVQEHPCTPSVYQTDLHLTKTIASERQTEEGHIKTVREARVSKKNMSLNRVKQIRVSRYRAREREREKNRNKRRERSSSLKIMTSSQPIKTETERNSK